MVLRQLLLDTAGTATVIVPDQIVGQWKRELATKFRVDYLPGEVEVVGHSAIESIRPKRRMLTIVDEAHRLTERVNYGGDSDRDRQYETLRAIAHASTALLLLSATPVRSNEDAFLGLLHLLDPVNYPLTDLRGFRRRVEMRDDLAHVHVGDQRETPLRYLRRATRSDLRVARERPRSPGKSFPMSGGTSQPGQSRRGQEGSQAACASMSPRPTGCTDGWCAIAVPPRLRRAFPRADVNCRIRGSSPIPIDRRQDLFAAFDDLRLDLELSRGVGWSGERSFRSCSGESSLLSPRWRISPGHCGGQPGHDLSAGGTDRGGRTRATTSGREFAGDLAQILAMTTESDRLSAAAYWARQRVGSRKCAIACSFPRTARLLARMLTSELGAHRVTALLEDQGEDERTRQATEFEHSTGTVCPGSRPVGGRRRKSAVHRGSAASKRARLHHSPRAATRPL